MNAKKGLKTQIAHVTASQNLKLAKLVHRVVVAVSEALRQQIGVAADLKEMTWTVSTKYESQ